MDAVDWTRLRGFLPGSECGEARKQAHGNSASGCWVKQVHANAGGPKNCSPSPSTSSRQLSILSLHKFVEIGSGLRSCGQMTSDAPTICIAYGDLLNVPERNLETGTGYQYYHPSRLAGIFRPWRCH
eukprot:1263321-Rhodomonas_salina.1